MMQHKIQIVPYDKNWPLLFEEEVKVIRKALEDNFIEGHHIGSTAVFGLPSKPVIDIIVIVDNILNIRGKSMELLGYKSMGEYGIPFRRYFYKEKNTRISNIHVYEKDNPEISRNILFRDWMRRNPEDLKAYAVLKKDLVEKFPYDIFSYCIGKESFVRIIDGKAGFDKFRFINALTPYEWENYHRIRKKQIFDRSDVIYNPNHPTMNNPDHFHFILYRGQEIVTVAHLEFLKNREVALRSIATDEGYKNNGFACHMMQLIEKWLRHQGKEVIKMHAYLGAEGFYRKLGYSDMNFDDISISKDIIDLGKVL
jgi:GrpB-like predicted nucleotidyltransferase (UPF0157 family)/ribosomal protein S18 acetylase RimI-like enzyme